ncbi:MAG: hypothetical protein ACI835_000453 [Planctomycetota bacterium]|jgi:hypothetical protein
MSSPIHSRQSAEEMFRRLEAAIESCRDGGRDQMFAARGVLQGFADSVEEGPWDHLKSLVEMAQMVLAQLLRRGSLDITDSMELLKMLTTFIDGDMKRDAPTIRIGDATGAPALRLADGGRASAPSLDIPGFSAINKVNETRLGEVLISMGLITSMELDRALVLQRVSQGRLGDILLGMNLIASPQLDEALQRQRDLTIKLTESGGKLESTTFRRRQV